MQFAVCGRLICLAALLSSSLTRGFHVIADQLSRIQCAMSTENSRAKSFLFHGQQQLCRPIAWRSTKFTGTTTTSSSSSSLSSSCYRRVADGTPILLLRGRAHHGKSLYAKYVGREHDDIVALWDGGDTSTRPLANSSFFDWYLSPLITRWTDLPIDRVRVELLDGKDRRLAALHFTGRQSNSTTDWMNRANLVHAFPWDLTAVNSISDWAYFSVHGAASAQRRFHIARSYSTDFPCLSDIGMISVSEGDTCVYDVEKSAALPSFLYAVSRRNAPGFLLNSKYAQYFQISITLRSDYEVYFNDQTIFN